MARKYPRFLFSDPQNTKSQGPFIVHTIDPIFIVRVAKCPNRDPGRMTHNGKYILFFLDDVERDNKLINATDAMFKWIDAQVAAGEIEIPYTMEMKPGDIRIVSPEDAHLI